MKILRKIGMILASIAMSISLITVTPTYAAGDTLANSTGTAYDGEKIVNFARQWIGKIPYVWGGRDMKNPTNGLDCSGFVDFVFISLGYTDLEANLWGTNYKITDVSMTGTAWWNELMKQKNVTYSEGTVQTISTGDARPGDIVIYYDANGTSYHMGIYSGNGKLIHECENLTTGAVNNVTESALDTCVEKHNASIKSVRIFRVANSDPDRATLSSTKSSTATVDVNLSVTKSDDESNKKLSEVEFEFHRVIGSDDVIIGTSKTNANGVASFRSTISQEFSATSSTYKYISDWKGVSDSVKNVWLNNGYLDGSTTELKAAIQTQADKEAIDQVNAQIKAYESQTITYYAVETKAKDKYYLNPQNSTVTKTQNNANDINWNMSNTRTKVTLELSKVDKDIDTRPQGDASLEGAKYGLFAASPIKDPADNSVIYETDTKILEVVTDNLGKASVQNLYLGNYYWKELEAPKGYKLDESKHTFEVNYNSQNVAIEKHSDTLTDDVITGQFEITKVITDGKNSTITQPESNAVFGVVLQKYVDQYGSVQEALNHQDEMTEKEFEIMTTDSNGHASSNDLAYGKYVVEQLENGAEEVEILNDSFTFEVNQLNQPTAYYVINNKPNEYQLMIEKVDLDTGKTVTLNSASFMILDSEGKPVKQSIGGRIYDVFTTNSDGKIGIIEKIKKVITTKEWSSEDDPKGSVITPVTLKAGKYTIEEINTPDGFLGLDKPIEFEIKASNVSDATEDGTPVIKVVVKNDQPTGKLDIVKTIEDYKAGLSFINRNDLSGIEFTLYAKEDITSPIDGSILYKANEVYGTYTTDSKGLIEVDNIPMGSYYLKETATLDGCVLNEETIDVNFLQNDYYTKEYVVTSDITNKTTKVEFSKKSVTGDNELEGAHLVVTDQDGNTIDEWDSGKKTHIIEGLSVGKTYTLTETICPNGYVKATSIKFTVSNTGDIQKVNMIDKVVTMTKEDVGRKEIEGATIQVKDQDGNIIDEWISTNEPHKIKGLEEGKSYILHEEVVANGYVKASDMEFTVSSEKKDEHITMIDKIVDMSKVDIAGKELPGAHIQVFDEDMNVVDEWVSTDKPHKIKGLMEGKSYILHEEDAPDGYVVSTDIEFTVSAEKVDQHLEMTDKQVIVTKVDQFNKFVENAKLQVLDLNGTVIDEWSSKEEHAVNHLKVGETYQLHEVSTPENYMKAKNIEFTVTEEMDTQFIKMIDIKTDEVAITKYDITNKKELPGAKLKLEDQNGNVIDEWISTKEAHVIKGLICGDKYTLTEVTAPKGYTVAEKVTFIVADNGKVVQQVHVYDKPKSSPPITGVPGPNSIYFAGAIISGLGIILLLRKKKQSK